MIFFHINDLFPICTEATRNGVSSILVISDNGPDYNHEVTSVKNELILRTLEKVLLPEGTMV